MIILIIISFLYVLYASLILFYASAWKQIPVFSQPETKADLRVTVIIPARNEADNIGILIEALLKQDYPSHLTEIIVVDDHSTDQTAAVVRRYPVVKLISLQEDGINSFKKKAVEAGIAASTGDFMITTDADCIPPASWLSTIAAFKKETNAVFIAAPVYMTSNGSFLEVFQSMDFSILQGITGASVNKKIYAMCNGANLGYDKKIFYEVDGFKGVDHIASGDDMLLMEKIRKRYPDRVHYLKTAEAIVATAPMKTWPAFFNQRIRWASKTLYYRNATIMTVLFLVYLLNLCFPVLLIASVWHPWLLMGIPILWILKTLVELPFYDGVSRFFGQKTKVLQFFLFQPVHIIYTCISGLFSQFGSYTWKGRKVK